jgi:hypothetical protein
VPKTSAVSIALAGTVDQLVPRLQLSVLLVAGLYTKLVFALAIRGSINAVPANAPENGAAAQIALNNRDCRLPVISKPPPEIGTEPRRSTEIHRASMVGQRVLVAFFHLPISQLRQGNVGVCASNRWGENERAC